MFVKSVFLTKYPTFVEEVTNIYQWFTSISRFFSVCYVIFGRMITQDFILKLLP